MKINDILNGLKWNPKYKNSQFLIKYIHRGVVGGFKEINFNKIIEIRKSYFIYLNEFKQEVIIPFHRILSIVDMKNNSILWKKK
jgi:uncharacterized protein (UPF0248 family)